MNTERRHRWSERRIILIATGVAIVVTLIWRLPGSLAYIAARLTEVTIIFIAAVVLAYMLKPLVDLLAASPRLGSGSARARAVAALLVLLTLIGGMVAATWWAVDKVTEEVVGWSRVLHLDDKEERDAMRQQIQQQVTKALDYYNTVLPPEIRPAINDWLNSAATTLLLSLSQGAKHTVHWLRLLAELVLVPILTFYFLTDAPNLRRELWLLVPPRYERQVQSLLAELDQVMNGYVRGQVILCIVAALIVTVGLLALRIRFALTLGLVAGVCRAIPFLGPVLGAIPLVIAAWVQKDALTALIVLVGSSAMHFWESKFLMPKVIGYKVGLHPVIVIAALMVGWEFFGILGMFLAAPVAAMLKITLLHYRAGWPGGEAVSSPSTPLPSQEEVGEGEGVTPTSAGHHDG